MKKYRSPNWGPEVLEQAVWSPVAPKSTVVTVLVLIEPPFSSAWLHTGCPQDQVVVANLPPHAQVVLLEYQETFLDGAHHLPNDDWSLLNLSCIIQATFPFWKKSMAAPLHSFSRINMCKNHSLKSFWTLFSQKKSRESSKQAKDFPTLVVLL